MGSEDDPSDLRIVRSTPFDLSLTGLLTRLRWRLSTPAHCVFWTFPAIIPQDVEACRIIVPLRFCASWSEKTYARFGQGQILNRNFRRITSVSSIFAILRISPVLTAKSGKPRTYRRLDPVIGQREAIIALCVLPPHKSQAGCEPAQLATLALVAAASSAACSRTSSSAALRPCPA